ncbi:SAM domain-containing protein [Trichostrongylus colubriformis]|uniref:SAM domain-containing protein n=1 Tax=Trichostrongylus colubriformis TaxID=6319 RepID=A0AAN8FP83_TRICO
MVPDDVVLLQDDRYEHKIQVDRRRLEAMITGVPMDQNDFVLMTAEEFFNKVKSYSGADVCWPSQLKIGAKTKKDPFVKVTGTLHQIEQARKYIAATLQVKVVLTMCAVAPTLYSCAMKSNAGDEDVILRAMNLVMIQLHVPEEFSVIVRTAFNVKEELLQVLQSGKGSERLHRLAQCHGVQLQIPETHEPVLIYGPVGGVLIVRKFIMGLSHVILSFDVSASEFSLDVERLQRELDLSIYSKRRQSARDVLVISIKSTEENMPNILRAREFILGIAMTTHFDNDYEMLKEPQASESEANIPFCPLFGPLSEKPRSPDPIDSPIASSILNGAKEYNKKSCFCIYLYAKSSNIPAVFDDSALSKAPRYPTDLWAGYGFSYSLPAELLKGIMDISQNDVLPGGRPILGKEAKTLPHGLCAVREEDELSAFSGSFSSNSMNSAIRIFAEKNGPAFSASTSTFDTSPVVSEISWDIRLFVDPAMVLAQLGCSEYMTQLREQEIDMHAFLLLDEQNLKDIGVSTIGARKKIHHAIMKLRESARMHGYAI